MDEEPDAAADRSRGRCEEVGDLECREVVLVDGGDEGAIFWKDPLGSFDEELCEVSWDPSS